MVFMAACSDSGPTPVNEPTEGEDEAARQAQEWVAGAAVSGELAGLPELTEFLRRSLRDDPRTCDEPEPRAEDREAVERRAFAAGSPEDAFAEVQQSTTAYRDASAAVAFMTESHALLAACDEVLADGQITRDFEVLGLPGDLEGEAIGAVMVVPGPDDEFVHRRGCVQREVLVQCTLVWAADDDLADEVFELAIAEGIAALESVDLGTS